MTGAEPGPAYRYRPDVREQLGGLGVQPRETTPPAFVRDFLNDLYRWELRRLRDQLVARVFPKSSFAGRVIALRRRYALLSLPLDRWLEPDTGDGPNPAA